MADINPYRDWLKLKIPKPTTLYELLDLPPFVRDVEEIRRAALRMKRRVRPYQIGSYRRTALRLLSQISRAVAILANPLKRRRHNRRLLNHWLGISNRIYGEQPGGVRDATAVTEWLLGAANWGVPVARLLPVLIRRFAAGQSQDWPAHIEGRLTFPAALLLYRDAVVLGQLVDRVPFAERVDAVRALQRALKVPEVLARKFVTEVAETRIAYKQMRLVRQAQDAPDQTLARLAKRLKRCGARLKSQSQIILALGKLLKAAGR